MEPEKNVMCQKISIVDNEVVPCDKMSNYRVMAYDDRESKENGEWVKVAKEPEYLCSKHFDQKYRYYTGKLPTFTFRSVERGKFSLSSDESNP